MREYVLWAQNESTEIKPTIIMDGEIINDEDIQQSLFGFLCEKNEKMCISPKKREKYLVNSQELYQDLSDRTNQSFNSTMLTTNVNYSIDNEGIYLQGSYINRDERGRLMPYMIYCKTTSVPNAITTLINASRHLKREPNSFELAVIEFVISRTKQSQKKNLLALTVILLLIMIVVFCLI